MFGLIGQVAGSLLNPITNAIQGQQNRIAQRKANEANIDIARENMQLQREFAQNGLIWQANQAKEIGLHPSAILGASSAQPATVTAGVQPEVGNEFSSMGQAISKTAKVFGELAMEQKKADIELTKSKAEALKGQNFGTAQDNVITKAAEVTATAKGSKAFTAGKSPGISTTQMGDGIHMSTKSKDVSELLEDDLVGNLTHAIVRATRKPPKSQLPKRADDWFWVGPGLWHPVSNKRAKMINKMSKSRREAQRS